MSGSTTAALIALIAVIAVVITALRFHERREATSHDDEDKAFSRAPRWGQILNQKLNTIQAGLSSIHRQIGREARADERRDKITMATQEQVLAKVAEATSVSKASNILVKEAIRLLKEGQSDPAKNDEAIALLEAGIADDNAVLTENTPEA